MASSAAFQNLNYVDLVPAVEKEDHEKVQAILKKFPSKINVTCNGQTAMHVAARNGDIKMMKILVGHNADYEVTDLGDNTPLHYAVKADKPEAVKHLLYLEINIEEKNSEGKTAAQIAFENKHNECLHHILDRYPMVSLERKVSFELTLESELKTSLTDEPAADGATGTGDADKCFYCKEEIATMTFEPCGHKTSCFGCSLSDIACLCGEAYEKISYKRTRVMENYINDMKAAKKKFESSQPANICPICTENKIDCILDCGHVFCEKCVRKSKGCKNEKGQQCWKCFYCKRSSRFKRIYLG